MKPIPESAVRVLLVSSRDSIGDMLELALGRDLVKPTLCAPLHTLGERLEKDADVIVVDGVMPPTIEPIELASILTRVSKDVWLAIWGADEPYGGQVTSALGAADIHCVPLPRREGIAPFIDLVRARKG
jgi:DNA-binding NtrC family response regulator